MSDTTSELPDSNEQVLHVFDDPRNDNGQEAGLQDAENADSSEKTNNQCCLHIQADIGNNLPTASES